MNWLKGLFIIHILLIPMMGMAKVVDPTEWMQAPEAKPPKEESSQWEKVTTKIKTWIDEATGSDKKTVKKEEPKAKQEEVTEAPKVDPEVEQQAALEAALPTYKSEKEVSPDDILKVTTSLQDGVLKTKSSGRVGTSQLQRSPAGVPKFSFQTKKTVKGKTLTVPKTVLPLLDIGEEPRLSMKDFSLPQWKFSLMEVKEAKPLPSPALVSDQVIKKWTNKKIAQVPPAKDLRNLRREIGNVVKREDIDKIQAQIKAENPVIEKPLIKYSPEDLKLLTALIMFKQGQRCPVVMGLLSDLADKDKYSIEANYYIGFCAHQMKLYSEAYQRLMAIIEVENTEFSSEAIRILATDTPMEYESPLAHKLMALKNQKLIPQDLWDRVNYLFAKATFKDGKYEQTIKYASTVSIKSPFYTSSQFLIGIAQYSLDQMKSAENTFETLRKYMAENKIVDNNLNSLTAINLARIKFNQYKFKEAHEYYMKIDKDHPVWVQGLIEQGWAQLSLDDYAGAIGNMYSLHSPYFRTVYKPESFVVRTIGYLNICQYGDAYKTLSWLEKEYRPWSETIAVYIAEKKLASDYYETVKTYLKGKSSENVNGLPYQVIREIARRKDFLNRQGSLNDKEDELTRFIGLNEKIKEDKARVRWRLSKARERFAKIKANLIKAKTDKSLAAHVNQWRGQWRNERDLILGYRYQLAMLEQGRQGYLLLQMQAEKRMDKEKYELREQAGRLLVRHLRSIHSDMSNLLDNNELLRYEVFAGSGENIRYQVAGGQTAESNRVPASVKPEKMLNWNFDGEFWVDEIGSYRSSLINNCPRGQASIE